MKKIICCDVDGVLLFFAGAFVKWYNAHHVEKISDADMHDYGFNIDSRDYLYKEIKMFWDTPFFSSMPLMDKDAPKYFNLLAKNNEMIIATAVDEKHRKSRETNLYQFDYDKIYFVPHDKAKFIIEKLKPDIAIEDKPDTIKELSAAGIKVYYPDLSYTKGLEKYGTKYNLWKELYVKLSV